MLLEAICWLQSLSLDLLLAAFWVAATLSVVAVAVVPSLRAFTDHGKLLSGKPGSFRVPKSCFSHFYTLGFAVNIIVLCSLIADRQNVWPWHEGGIVGHLAFQLHVGRRWYESTYINNTSGGSMHLLAYAFGLCYYAMVPLSFSVSCRTSAAQVTSARPVEGLLAKHLLGASLFLLGSVHQNRCHRILADLRSGEVRWQGQHKAASYILPYGDWFEMVTAPHYFAEILVYAGFWCFQGLATSVSMPTLFVFVVVNLSFTAFQSHRWYLEKFESYPKERRIILPFLF